MNRDDDFEIQEVAVAKFETERLVLRPFEAKDAAGLFEMLSHPRVHCFAPDRLDSMEAAVADVARRSADPVQLAVCLKEQDVMIGLMFAANDELDTYGLGWHLNSSHEGKGYASEAARAFIDILFTHKGARRVYAYVEDDNIRSQKLCERLGMRREGLFKEFISFVSNADGTPKYENTCLYALLKKEWKNNR